MRRGQIAQGLRRAKNVEISSQTLSQRLLLLPAILAGEFDPDLAFFSLHTVGRAAFAAGGLDPRVAVLDDEGFLFHGFADQALGLLTHSLLRHLSAPRHNFGCGLIARGLRMSNEGDGIERTAVTSRRRRKNPRYAPERFRPHKAPWPTSRLSRWPLDRSGP